MYLLPSLRPKNIFRLIPSDFSNGINITPDLPFLHIHNPFTNERISVYLDKHSRMSLDTTDYIVK